MMSEDKKSNATKRPREEEEEEEETAKDSKVRAIKKEETKSLDTAPDGAADATKSSSAAADATTTTTTPATAAPAAASSTSSKSRWWHAEIPNTAHYHVSWMHADVVTHCTHAASHGIVLTASRDGVVKFWKRHSLRGGSSSAATTSNEEPLEFAKAITAHAAPIVSLTVSAGEADDAWAASVDNAGHIQFYHVALLDAPHRCNLGNRWPPHTAAWVKVGLDHSHVLVVSGRLGPMQVISAETGTALQTLWVHGQDVTVTALVFNPVHHCVMSGDDRGMLQMWDTHGDYDVVVNTATTVNTALEVGGVEPATMVKIGASVSARRNQVNFTSRLDTQLLHMHQKQTYPLSMAVTPDGSHYAIYGRDQRVRLFVHQTGHLLCTYDERLKIYDKQHASKPYHLDAMEYGRRAALERDMQSSNNPALLPANQIQFEATQGRFLIVPTLVGLKVIDWKRHKLVKLVGAVDAAQQRFIGVVQCPGPAQVDAQLQLARQQQQQTASSSSTQISQAEKESEGSSANAVTDALLVAWAYQSRRFFVFSHIDPVNEKDDDGQALIRRDHWNEQPDAQDTAAAALSTTTSTSRLANTAVLHTTLGDISIQLFGQQTPKTVENFGTHARNGYYDGLLFHRVIKGFMLQTGDPNGDGTGGESIWGGEFEDEIVQGLRHDRPFTVSMANAGVNTNGSQFFITTVPCPWLDGKHTVFGRVQRGMDVCTLIENAKTDDNDKPLKEIQIINIDIS